MASKSYIYILDWTQSHNAIKIGKANDIQARYYQLKQHYGKADLDNSYWIEVPVSKVTNIETLIHLRLNQYKKNPSIQADGSTEFFEKSAINSLKELCEDMGLTIHKGIKKAPQKNKRKKVDYAYQQQKKKEKIEKQIRNDQRVLKRIITVFKYLNSNKEKFVPKYEKPSDKELVRLYNSTANAQRFLKSIILCPEHTIKISFLKWFREKSNNFSVRNLINQIEWEWHNNDPKYATSIYIDSSFLIPFKYLRDLKKTDFPDIYNYINENLIYYIREVISLVEDYLSNRKANFDINTWLNPVFEWQNEDRVATKAGEFKFLKTTQREINIKLEIDKIKSIKKNIDTWDIELNDGKSTILSISQNLFNSNKDYNHLVNRILFLLDEINYFKFLRFIEDLFIKDKIYSNTYEETIFYPKEISNKSYSLDDISDIF